MHYTLDWYSVVANTQFFKSWKNMKMGANNFYELIVDFLLKSYHAV